MISSRSLIFTALAGMLFVACAPKLYNPSDVHAGWVNDKYTASVSPETLSQGKVMYTQYCQTCHYLHMPKEFTISEWDNVFPPMSEKISLADSSKQKIYYYIIAGAKDAK